MPLKEILALQMMNLRVQKHLDETENSEEDYKVINYTEQELETIF